MPVATEGTDYSLICKGRESRFGFDPQPLVGMKEYLDFASQHWDQSLSRLKSFVEG
ncbi:MAG TPA: hypothetical protein VJO16_15285 [Candidatus Acidoferrum sp.]|nr:hypothetical protein [Candidatus Acidoferrum sp.]